MLSAQVPGERAQQIKGTPSLPALFGKDGVSRTAIRAMRWSKSIYWLTAFALALISAFVLSAARAQTVTEQTIVSNTPDILNSLFQASDGNFYGVAPGYDNCGSPGDDCGAIYKITPAGVVTLFYQFTTVSGFGPNRLMEASDGNFYGTTGYGGANGAGTIYQLTPSGGFTLLHSFLTASDGQPGNSEGSGNLVEGVDGNLYGAAANGGPGGGGTIFKITTSGVFSLLYGFAGTFYTEGNINGVNPQYPNDLVQGSDGNFYGTTQAGGTNGSGSFFKMTPSGSLTTLYSFTNDANDPQGALLEGSDGNFYGMDQYDIFFKLTPAGNFSLLYTAVDNDLITEGLTLAGDGNFYSAITGGGNPTSYCPYGCGTVFELQPSGDFSTIYNFTGNADGAAPVGFLALGSDGKLYGIGTGSSQGLEAGFGSGSPTIPGTVDSFALSPAIPAPVELSLSQQSVNPGSSVTLTWQVLNAFSSSMQQCAAFIQGAPAGAGTWTGLQAGTLSNSVYSGSATITPTVAGSYTYALTCGGQESGFATLNVGNVLTVSTSTLPIAIVGTAYSQALAATGGTGPYTWSITSGALPAGLSLASDGVISGTPAQNGTASLVVQVADSENTPATATANLSLQVQSGLVIATAVLPNGVVGTAYSQTLEATGGIVPYTWTLTAGALPAGLSLSSSGVISGTPTAVGTSTFTIRVADSEGTPATSVASLSLTTSATVTKSASTTTLTTSSPTIGTGASVTFTATVAGSGGVPTGTVTFYNGTASLGTGTLSGGVATLTTSFSTAGTASITAAYGGDANFTASTSAALTETIVTAGVTATFSPASLSVAPGSSGTLTITVTPQGGYTGAVGFSCGTLPANLSCAFAPSSITLTATGGAVTDTLTINTSAPSAARISPLSFGGPGIGIFAGMVLWLPASLAGLLGFSRRTRGNIPMRRMWMLALLCLSFAGVAAMSGCGGGSSISSSTTTAAGSYSIPINLTLAGGASQTVDATVVVQ